MRQIKDPFQTTVRGISSSQANAHTIARQIQNKIMFYGICSDKEQDFLTTYINNVKEKQNGI